MQNLHCWSRFYRDFWVNVSLDCISGTLLSLSGNIPFQRDSYHRRPRPSMKFKVNELCFLSITVLARPYMFACLCSLYWNVFCCLLSSWGNIMVSWLLGLAQRVLRSTISLSVRLPVCDKSSHTSDIRFF